jgi:tRNA(Ile2) C34 agmatinyltransferase TiaS
VTPERALELLMVIADARTANNGRAVLPNAVWDKLEAAGYIRRGVLLVDLLTLRAKEVRRLKRCKQCGGSGRSTGNDACRSCLGTGKGGARGL